MHHGALAATARGVLPRNSARPALTFVRSPLSVEAIHRQALARELTNPAEKFVRNRRMQGRNEVRPYTIYPQSREFELAFTLARHGSERLRLMRSCYTFDLKGVCPYPPLGRSAVRVTDGQTNQT